MRFLRTESVLSNLVTDIIFFYVVEWFSGHSVKIKTAIQQYFLFQLLRLHSISY